MPRNCDPEIFSRENMEFHNIEEMIKSSNAKRNNPVLIKAYDVLRVELDGMFKNSKRVSTTKRIKYLRTELLQTAQNNKSKFVIDNPKISKSFDQFINHLIHISQQHLEKAILREE